MNHVELQGNFQIGVGVVGSGSSASPTDRTPLTPHDVSFLSGVSTADDFASKNSSSARRGVGGGILD